LAWLRRRPGGVALEIGIAAAVLLVVALTAATSPAKTAAAPDRAAEKGWPGRALPVITALVDDLSAIDGATKAGEIGRPAFSQTRSGFLSDFARARSLGSPGGSLAAMWSGALGQIGVVASALSSEGSGSDDGQLRPEAEGAAEALVSFVGSMQQRTR
jgi:hypothetical protein